MCAEVGLSIFIAATWIVTSTEAVEKYYLDNRNVCHSTGVITKWLGDGDVILIYGKLDPESSFNECNMVFGPGTEATKLSTVIQFQTYSNRECAVYLLFEQSPYQFFDKEVSTVVNLTCLNQPGATKFYTDAGSNLRIKLHKSHSHLRNYNFIFNMTLTDHEIHTEVSSIIIIIIGIIIAIIIPLIGCIVYKALKIKRWSKQHYSSSVDLSQPGNHHLRSFDLHSTPPSVRYSSMPLGDQENTDSLHSQTCIVGSQGADGRCTVCNRSHEDFAHVVDVDLQGVVMVNAPRPCGRSHDDFVHFEEVNGHSSNTSTENQRLLVRTNPPILTHSANIAGARGGNRYIRNRNARGPDERRESDDDEDIDVSGNDLIPPSYDLCPPSYDEAVDMPAPAGRVPSSSLDQEEVDPLYQNIDDLLTNT